MRIHWTLGSPELREAVEQWLDGQHEEACEVLSESTYRRVVKLSPVAGQLPYPVVIKDFRPISSRWSLRRRLLGVIKLAGPRRIANGTPCFGFNAPGSAPVSRLPEPIFAGAAD